MIEWNGIDCSLFGSFDFCRVERSRAEKIIIIGGNGVEIANKMSNKEMFLTFIGDETEWEQVKSNGEENKECQKCKKMKSRIEFYGDSYKECKECHSNRVQANKELEAMRAIEKLLVLGIINNNEISSARTLYLSCESRINACKYNIGIYKDIECHWKSPLAFMMDIIQELPKVWKGWKIQNAIYEETKDDSDRPTIDRKNEKGNYDISNIQMLSRQLNTKKATEHMQGAMIMRETETNYNIIGLEIFSSKKELAKRLGVDERLIYTCKPGQVIKIDDIVIQFQDVIKGEPKPITKQEVLEKLDRYSSLIKHYENKGLTEHRDRIQRLYDIWRNTGESKGFFKEVTA